MRPSRGRKEAEKKKWKISQDWKLFWFYILMGAGIVGLIFIVESMIVVEGVICHGEKTITDTVEDWQ